MAITVLVADDEPLDRCGISMILEAEDDIAVVAQVADGDAAVAATRRLRPDVAVIDVRMPGTDGVEATRQILATGDGPGRTEVLILTTFDLDETVYATLRLGVAGFLLKHTAPAHLVDAVRAVALGEGWLDRAIVRRLVREFAGRPAVAPTGAAPDVLTPREDEVLRLLATGLSNADLAAALFISEATVKTHVSRILTKLDLRDRTQATALAYRLGLVAS